MRLFLAVLLSASPLFAAQPLSAVNFHPFSINHFNPAMEGSGERTDLSLAEVTYYEQNDFSLEGHDYRASLDFELSVLQLFLRREIG